MDNSSEKILNRLLLGSETAAFEIFERYQNRLLGLARQKLLECVAAKVDSDDIAQEAFVAFFDLAERGDVRWGKTGDLWRLLAGIAINKVRKCHEHYLRDKRSIRSETSLHESQQRQRLELVATTDGAVTELVELTESVLAAEKPLVRQVVQFRLAGFTMSEIANRTGRSARTIQRLIENIRAKIVADENMLPMMDSVKRIGLQNGGEQADPVNLEYSEFRLLSMIGLGSFAKVYLARHEPSQQLYAVKAVRKKWLNQIEVIQSFYREYQFLQQLDEPDLVKVFGMGQLPGGGCFLVLELIQGHALAEVLDQSDSQQRTQWAGQIRSIIERLREAGIEHGDLHLKNFMIDEQGNVRVIDLGFAAVTDGKSSSSETGVGAAKLAELIEVIAGPSPGHQD